MRVAAYVTRDGDWLAVRVLAVPGLLTQARELSEVPAMVRDAARLLTGEDVEVNVIEE